MQVANSQTAPPTPHQHQTQRVQPAYVPSPAMYGYSMPPMSNMPQMGGMQPMPSNQSIRTDIKIFTVNTIMVTLCILVKTLVTTRIQEHMEE
jgi:hypothetical protein